MESFTFELFPSRGLIHISLFRNVTNAAELRKRLLARDQELSYAFIDARVVFDLFQVLVAVNNALYYEKLEKLKTFNVHSEIVYFLSPTTNITESLRRFGISDVTNAILVVKVGGDATDVKSHLSSLIQGEMESNLDTISHFADLGTIKKYYKIDNKMTDRREILECLIGTIAIKPVL
ncbi:4624_t:CDS:2 [Ambispora gerdemannii]|uniref:EKC/KEOPS complex subunit CGI121 n=1 Tax=Ambispora gerdemannii TaxID=144530 RepID=A0A9N8ZMB4_9GLOM|nr:4624_t:CDS:2 [Ambispora gerdemannii]